MRVNGETQTPLWGGKQSRALPIDIGLTALDCFVAALLAMTAFSNGPW